MTENEEIELKKVVWANMLESGHITDGDFSYYGGCYTSPFNSFDKRNKEHDDLYAALKTVGVDWKKTGVPDFEHHAEFAGTDCDSDWVDCYIGILVLNNGKEYRIGTANVGDVLRKSVACLQANRVPKDEDLVAKYF